MTEENNGKVPHTTTQHILDAREANVFLGKFPRVRQN